MEEVVVESTEIVVTQPKPAPIDPAAIEAALMRNDYGRLPVAEKVALSRRTCESMGLNPLTQPFGFFKMSGGAEVLYAKRTAADQLRQIHGITLVDCSETWDKDTGIFSITVRMRDKHGREDIDRGDVFIPPTCKGMDLANAKMKAITKAKRRCTLSLVGLGFLDETEVMDARLAVIKQSPEFVSEITQTPMVTQEPLADEDAKRQAFILFKDLAEKIPDLKAQMMAKFPGLDSKTMTRQQCAALILFLDSLKS